MDKHVAKINKALLLRKPQLRSLERLAWVADNIKLPKSVGVDAALEILKEEYPNFKCFERDFPSLCFALATGVGKTRLMGAAIAYLYAAKGMKNFFVLAPNLTIYDKLVSDFKPKSPKYVFKGLPEFTAQSPEIITAETYENRGGMFAHEDDIHINIFNISKINSEVRGDKPPRIKRMSEYIGHSYFEKLAGQDDLVLLMDEAHHYRASAGMKAINELKPALGIELTATPFEQNGNKKHWFKNIIYNYPLYNAMVDKFVKEPAVAMRTKMKPKNMSEEELGKRKLEDGIKLHKKTKTELEIYAANYDKPLVKPFMMVIANSIEHANSLAKYVQSDEFFNGEYNGRVLNIHTGKSRADRDAAVQDLLLVERTESLIEIVIHVNMLKEGWDVTNLYTIVPLRPANSVLLVEQAIGRGLRLPYGERTGVPAVDRLSVVAHDNFDKIIDAAKENESIFSKCVGIDMDKDDSYKKRDKIVVKSKAETLIEEQTFTMSPQKNAEMTDAFFESIARVKTPRIAGELCKEDTENKIAKNIQDRCNVGLPEAVNATKELIQTYIKHTIQIPDISWKPEETKSGRFEAFDLVTKDIERFQPAGDKMKMQDIRTGKNDTLEVGNIAVKKENPEKTIVQALRKLDDISYDKNPKIINNLAAQMVEYIGTYLKTETEVMGAVQNNCDGLVSEIRDQMLKHYIPGATKYANMVAQGFMRPRPIALSHDAKEKLRCFRDKVEEPLLIRGMVFTGFKRCLYPSQEFHSNTERAFAELLENEKDDLKWCKLMPKDLTIDYSNGREYHPDFVVETAELKLLCETKMKKDSKLPEVQEKSKAAQEWCRHASKYEKDHGGKPWEYVLIEHDKVKPSISLEELVEICPGEQKPTPTHTKNT